MSSKILNKGMIEELYKQGYGYAEIGRHTGVSRQRIHQIVANYKNIGRKGREEKYRNLGACEDCERSNAVLLHHKDFNNSNDDWSNLEKLCRDCHVKKHAGKQRKKFLSSLRIKNSRSIVDIDYKDEDYYDMATEVWTKKRNKK